jgi:SAM-dependent methyltransferase
MKKDQAILKEVGDYYSDKIKTFGVSAQGVDWNSETSQELRFEQLLKVVQDEREFSLLDYGCGYGALLDFLNKQGRAFSYIGFDISEEMLIKARSRNPERLGVSWKSSLKDESCDYTLASGIFNVKLSQEQDVWQQYIEDTLNDMNNRSMRGFSFNMLTSYSDKEYMKDYLFYADPSYYFQFCKKHFSKYVALLHDYPLYEFTVIVKK